MHEIDKVRSQLKDANERTRNQERISESAKQYLQTIDVLVAHAITDLREPAKIVNVVAARVICEAIQRLTELYR
jgi:hypothetical protein